MARWILLFFCLTPFVSAAEEPAFAPKCGNGAKWFHLSDPAKARGVSVIVHGLNYNPDKMQDMIDLLHRQGQEVVMVTLSGHEGDIENFKKANRERWLGDMYSGYCLARPYADEHKLPLNFIGFSIGALMNVDLMENFPALKVKYDRQVLLAPALSVRTYSYLIKILNVFGPEMLVPSFAGRAYRASCDGTPMAAYMALFDSLRHVDAAAAANINIPTLVLLDPADELVSENGLKSFIAAKKLDAWKMGRLSTKGSTLTEGDYHHFIVAEPSVGPVVWKQMEELIAKHLAGIPLPESIELHP